MARRQVQDIFERIASVVPPQTLARVFSDAEYEHAERIKQQKAQVLEYFPEWHDPEHMARDRDGLVELARTYGLPRQDVANIQDARIVKFMVDAWRLRQRYERLKNGGLRDKPKPSTEPPSRRVTAPHSMNAQKHSPQKGIRTVRLPHCARSTRNEHRKPRLAPTSRPPCRRLGCSMKT